MTDNTANIPNGKQEFTMNYSERELTCHIEKQGDTLHLHMDNNIDADFKFDADGNLVQTSGPELPPSNLEFIRKQIGG